VDQNQDGSKLSVIGGLFIYNLSFTVAVLFCCHAEEVCEATNTVKRMFGNFPMIDRCIGLSVRPNDQNTSI
jgi:hypothetical protein